MVATGKCHMAYNLYIVDNTCPHPWLAGYLFDALGKQTQHTVAEPEHAHYCSSVHSPAAVLVQAA